MEVQENQMYDQETQRAVLGPVLLSLLDLLESLLLLMTSLPGSRLRGEMTRRQGVGREFKAEHHGKVCLERTLFQRAGVARLDGLGIPPCREEH